MLNKKIGFFGKLKENLGQTFLGHPKIDEEFLNELEEALIISDLGLNTVEKIIASLREKIKKDRLENQDDLTNALAIVIEDLVNKNEANKVSNKYPLLVLTVGVNGTGKTTTVAKLAKYFNDKGLKTVLVAADTFRAAATEQLTLWANKLSLPIVKRTEGEDPGAVIFDAISYLKENEADVLVVDTAGRLQNKQHLMKELEKIDKIISKNLPEINRETLLVLDATIGKNAISQAEEFNNTSKLTGTVLTKIDGTTKGGISITITDEFNLPIKFLGTGERLEDLEEFDPKSFAESILE